MKPRQCQHIDSKGKRCPKDAFSRLHFYHEHPFDFVEVCEGHSYEYKAIAWIEYLKQKAKPDDESKEKQV